MTTTSRKTALLLLDLQNEMVDPEGKIGGGGLAKVCAERNVVANAARALGAARERGLPVAHVRLGFRPDYADALSVAPRIEKLKQNKAAIAGTWGTEFPEPLTPKEGELLVTKQCVNPFFNTGLMNWLFANGVGHVVLGGVVTNLVVEMTTRAADDAGFAVTVLEDCCAAPNPDWHRFSVENIIPMFGSVSSVDAFVAGRG
ncbi:cysteine hydrolase [Propylenella binzhouense]|uniref:Cysteine hydrolase n=1 Tax=Propylenella binzhouense TaxID=2555902 RepID=A0A964T1H8_9HYPH|nr:cysteine hydrolase [Propylenella binzhouense]MYZ46259.1 cysteine hydrolase [Propylenella binzhouense]